MKKLMLLALGFVLTFMFMAPTNSLAGKFIGKYCFMGGADLWQWNVESIGADSYTVTGSGPYPSAMVGGGRIVGDTIYFAVTETEDNGRRAIHAIKLDVTTLEGTNDTSYHNPDGSGHNTFSDMPVSRTSCPSSFAEGVNQTTND